MSMPRPGSTTNPCGSSATQRSSRAIEGDAVVTPAAHTNPPGGAARQRIASRAISRVRRSARSIRSEEHTSELQSLMRISYAVFCLKKKKKTQTKNGHTIHNTQQNYKTEKNHRTTHEKEES